jgi:hypothetical protein
MLLRRIVPQRRNEIKQYASHRKYKSYLREDFNKRCGYCDADDKFLGASAAFHVDHFAPQRFEERKTDYTNLIYSCRYCNGSKSDYWPSDCSRTSVLKEEGVIDPCEAIYDEHLARNEKGYIYPLTNLGGFIHKLLKLGLTRHSVLWKLQHIESNLAKMDDQIRELSIEQLQIYQQLSSEYRNLITYICEYGGK